MPRTKFNALARHLQDIIVESLPKMVDERIKKILQTQVPLHVAQRIILEREKIQVEVAKMIVDAIQQERENFRSEISSQVNYAITNHIPSPSVVRLRDQDDPHNDAHHEGENSPSTSSNQEQSDDFDFWTNSYATDDDVLPNEKVSQELVDKMSQTVHEAKLRKVVDEMLRQQCTSGDEHQSIIVPTISSKPTPVVQSCQRDHKAHVLSLVNQDLLYLTGPEKIALSLHKFPTIRFPDNDIEERTSRWTYWELGHEHKFITEIVARRANGCIVSITESDYKNLNKNDIEDMYLLIINHKVDDYAETGLLWSLSVFIRSTVIWERVHDFQLGVESYQQQVNLTAPTITFPGIEKYKVFFIVSEPVYGIIYKNNKKEKRVMRHQEVHKFCDATLKRVLEGLKSYNNDVKYGYVTHNLSKEDVEYLQLFAEEIEERLKYRDQMRRWEMYVNGRPLGSRRERPE
ncbi:hypothetical protein Tco_0720136 [Tanacetum coccineum]